MSAMLVTDQRIEQIKSDLKRAKVLERRLAVAVEAAKQFNEHPNNPFQLGTAIIDALDRTDFDAVLQPEVTVDYDGLLVDQQTSHSEAVTAYIEQFNALMDEGQYDKAALCAANSPKATLRSMFVLKRFKAINPADCGYDPLFLYAQAVMDSVNYQDIKLEGTLSLEMLSSALRNCEFSAVEQWVRSRPQLTLGEEMAVAIRNCEAMPVEKRSALAAFVYDRLGRYEDAALCLVEAERPLAGLHYLRRRQVSAQRRAQLAVRCRGKGLIELILAEEDAAGVELLPLLCSDDPALDEARRQVSLDRTVLRRLVAGADKAAIGQMAAACSDHRFRAALLDVFQSDFS